MLKGFITLPVFSRFLTPEDYGVLSVVSTFTAMVTISTTFQIFKGVARLYFDYSEEERKTYYSTMFWGVCTIASVVLVGLVAGGDKLVGFFFTNDKLGFYPYFFISTITIFFSLPEGVSNAWFKVKEKGKPLLILSFIASMLELVVQLVLIVVYNQGAKGALIGLAIGAVFRFFTSAIYFRKYLVLRFCKSMFWENVKFGLPVIPHALGGYLFMYSDIFILEKFVSLSVIGIYSMANRFATLLKTIVNSFAQAFSPVFMKTAMESKADVVQLTQKVSKSWFVLLTMGYVFLSHVGEYTIYVMTPKEYHEAALYLPALSLAYIFRGIYILPINTFYFSKKTKLLPLATLSSGVLNVVLNIWLIPKWGLWGAVGTTTLSFGINWILYELLSHKTFRLQYEKMTSLLMLIVVIISNVVFYSVHSFDLLWKLPIQLGFLLIFYGWILVFDVGDIKEFLVRWIFKKR